MADRAGDLTLGPAEHLVDRLVAWLDDQAMVEGTFPLAGATPDQQRRLAALGGVAAAFIADAPAALCAVTSPLRVWLDAPAPPNELIRAIKRSGAVERVFADAYCRVLPPRSRRVLGTFFTPPGVVDRMFDTAASLLGRSPTVVIDPGAGVGAFTAAALTRYRVAQVHAVDVNVVTLGLLAARCSVLTPSMWSRLEVHHDDYLEWVRSTRPPGSVLTIGNPPYTRHQLLSASQKDAGAAAAGNILQNRNSTLAGYFIAATLGQMRAGDATVLLVPSNWLHAHYAAGVREWLWHRSAREVIVEVLEEVSLFPDADVAASVLAVGPVRPSAARLELRSGSTRREFTSKRTGDPPADWRSLVRDSDDQPGREGRIFLGDVMRVRRGVATGANAFFVVQEEIAERLGSRWVVRAAGRLHRLEGEVLDEDTHHRLSKAGSRCWLVRIPPDADIAALQWYLDEGIAAGVPMRLLARRRARWWSIERLDAPPLLLQPMTKRRFRVVTNEVRAFHTNTLYGLYPRGLNADAVAAIAEWLRSDAGQAALRRAARSLSSGLLRVEPRAVASLALPDVVASMLGALPLPFHTGVSD